MIKGMTAKRTSSPKSYLRNIQGQLKTMVRIGETRALEEILAFDTIATANSNHRGIPSPINIKHHTKGLST